MSKTYKKRKQAAHTKKKTPRNMPKEDSKFWNFVDNWLWLITFIVIVGIAALLIIFIPKCDSTCVSCSEWIDSKRYAISVAEEGEQLRMPEAGETIAVLETSMGTVKLRLFPDNAPRTVENFTKLIKRGYYDGVSFHRVINDFMIQCGDPTGTGSGGESIWGESFKDEFNNGLYNFRGALSMANTGDPDSNSSQFFIVQAKECLYPAEMLTQYGMSEWAANVHNQLGGYAIGDHVLYDATGYLGHTVFGQVIEGMDVVDAIAAVEVADTTNYKPVEDVVIVRAYLEKYVPAEGAGEMVSYAVSLTDAPAVSTTDAAA